MRKRRPEPELQAFATRLRECRLTVGLSQEDLSEATGIHTTYIGALERCTANPTLLLLQRLADALGVPVSRLVADE